MGYFFILPWLIGIVLFLLYPLGQSFRYIWYNIRITPRGTKFNFIGTGNFTQIWMEDPEFPQQLVTYIWQTIVEVPIIVVFSLLIAMMLNQKIKGRSFFRLVFFLPVIIVSGPVMNMLVSEGAATIPALNVQSVITALDRVLPTAVAQNIGDMFSNMIMILWYSGVQILIFISALQKMDPSLYEAAKIDGASTIRTFFSVIFPLLKNVTITVIVLDVMWIWNDFLLPLLMVNSSAKTKTLVLSAYTFVGQFNTQWQYAMASMVLAIVPSIIVFVLLQKYIIEGVVAGAVKG